MTIFRLAFFNAVGAGYAVWAALSGAELSSLLVASVVTFNVISIWLDWRNGMTVFERRAA